MPTLKRFALSVILLLFAAAVFAGPLQEGADAFRAGDFAHARELWLPLAREGNADAQFNLGLLYQHGRGVERDPRKALEWYRQAAEAGQPDAQYNLGVMYASADGVFRNNREAAAWWRKAAAQNHPGALYNLGVLRAFGLGVERDRALATTYWLRAAGRGSREAAAVLADAYAGGHFGLPVDPNEAERWRQRAATGTR